MTSLTVSIVSHSHGKYIERLLNDINSFDNCDNLNIKVILTINTPENMDFLKKNYSFELKIIKNEKPLGYGANNNKAFGESNTDYFAVLNPDIRMVENPFEKLISCLSKENIGVVAPAILNEDYEIQDSARIFPNFFEIVKKAFGGKSRRYFYSQGESPLIVDWVGGMFMVFDSKVFREFKFNELYFMYYEDVDICFRLKQIGLHAMVCPECVAIHVGQKKSHHNLRHMVWHIRSLIIFLGSRLNNSFKKVLK